jgi:hypothetical protein
MSTRVAGDFHPDEHQRRPVAEPDDERLVLLLVVGRPVAHAALRSTRVLRRSRSRRATQTSSSVL